jgi:hypothetical protein
LLLIRFGNSGRLSHAIFGELQRYRPIPREDPVIKACF